MALRHVMPLVGGVRVDRSVEPSRPNPVLREPAKASFRNGADLRSVVQVISTNRMVNVDAAVGSGKTVKLPAAIAKALEKLVLHVMPAELLVRDQAKYVGGLVDIPTTYVTDPNAQLPQSGIVFMSSATLIAKLYAGSGMGVDNVVLFLDEIHESDNWTYLCRHLSGSWSWAAHIVKASATFSAVGHRVRETDGQIAMRTFPKEWTVDKWDPLDEDRPWSFTKLNGSLLMFVDSKTHADRLVAAYDELGLTAFRMYSRMPVDIFDHAMNMLRDKDGPLVVLIADYSFRSGFTFDVSRIIDSGLVAYVAVEEGAPVQKWRAAFSLERYQGAGRGARTPGSSAEYFAPDFDAPNAICDLEGVEMDAAALGYRLLGYQPPRVLASSKFFSGLVPKDIEGALRGPQPLSCMTDNMLEDFVKLCKRDSGVDMGRDATYVRQNAVSALGGSYREEAPVTVPYAARAGAFVPMKNSLEFWEDQLEKLSQMQLEDDVVVEPGRYYTARGISDQPRRSAAFPDGMVAVQRLMAESNFTYRLKCLRSSDRMVALACVLDRYNAVTAELEALAQVIAEDPYAKAGQVVRRDAKARWARHLMELAASHSGELRVLGEALPYMCDGVSELLELTQGMPDVVDQFKAYHLDYARHFGAGHYAEVELDYVDGFQRQDRQYVADAPARSGYVLQAGLHGVPAKYLESRHQHSTSNVKVALSRKVMAWAAGMEISPEGMGRNRAMDPDHRFLGGTSRKKLF